MVEYSDISFHYPIEWRIKRFHVFRILDNVKWLENFFERGEIQLSCFNEFRNYPDEMIGDKTEGSGYVAFQNPNGGSDGIKYESGLNAFILSTTKKLSERVIQDFRGTCAIRINHPTLFGIELARKLPFVNYGVEGECDYGKYKVSMLKESDEVRSLSEHASKRRYEEAKMELKNITMGIELFAKHNKYRHQKEFRFVWFCNREIDSKIIVHCPEAIQYCEPIVF